MLFWLTKFNVDRNIIEIRSKNPLRGRFPSFARVYVRVCIRAHANGDMGTSRAAPENSQFEHANNSVFKLGPGSLFEFVVSVHWSPLCASGCDTSQPFLVSHYML